MLDFPINPERIANALEDLVKILFRVELALTRIAPPIPNNPPPRRAELSDLRRVDPDTVQSIHDSTFLFAKNANVEPNSDLMYQYMRDWEERMEATLGEDSPIIDELPWNKAAGGRIFRKEETSKEDARQAHPPIAYPGETG